MLIIADSVKEDSSSSGTGDLVLNSALTGFRRFSSVCSVGDTAFCVARGVDAGGSPTADWEVFYGTYSAANTLTRTTTLASSNGGSAVNFPSGGTTHVALSFVANHAKWLREKLSSDTSFYVATTGSDTANSGRSAGSPFLTIQKAFDVIASLDANGYTPSIIVSDGTYTAPVVVKPIVGGNKIIITGNVTTPANVVISTTNADAITHGVSGLTLTLSGLKLATTTAGSCLRVTNSAICSFSNINFGSSAGVHVFSSEGGDVQITGNYAISGSAGYHWYAYKAGRISLAATTVLAISGTPAFTTFAIATMSAIINCRYNWFSFTGSATGTRYSVNNLSGIFVEGGATTIFPGSVAGTATGASFGYYG